MAGDIPLNIHVTGVVIIDKRESSLVVGPLKPLNNSEAPKALGRKSSERGRKGMCHCLVRAWRRAVQRS